MPRYAYVRQRPGRKPLARITAPDGRQISKAFETPEEANAWAIASKASFTTGRWIRREHAGMTVAEWAETWLAGRIDVRPSTRLRDERNLRNHIVPRFGHRKIADVVQPEVRMWVVDLAAGHLAPATVHKCYQIMCGLMKTAADANVICVNPCYNVPLPRIEHREMRYLRDEEIGRLLAVMPDRYRAFVSLGCHAGLRAGELAGLDRADLDLNTRRVHVTKNAVEVNGHLTVGPVKTKAARRTVPLSGEAIELLRNHLDRYVSDSSAAPVFTGTGQERLRVHNFRSRVWFPAIERAGLPGLRIHDMRHTAVTLWISSGANDLQIARWAGHTSVTFTKNQYGHLFDDDADAVMAALDRRTRAVRATPDRVATVIPLRPNAV